ncbi:MAG TPA: sulfatase-like hydrolase/transferase [Candidatus Dormibacteraeota bacterium]|nr:sulfatase-like hydrolase/transferase [Candidatus Dormibacteraeota bacterium]
MANLPFIKSLGRPARARTAGTFTLPAHMAFFGGYLPIDQASREPYYNPNVRQLWRLKSGRSRDLNSVGIMLDGNNVLEGYRNLGYHTIGTGGVRWFRNAMLQRLFDEFHFYGPDDQTSVFAERRRSDLALNRADEILERLSNKRRWFLFVNCLETHVPYDTGNGELTARTKEIMARGQQIWGCKSPSFDNVDISQKELQSLHKLQVTALESIDAKVEKLIKSLPKPLLVIITGDHGECFGENMFWGHGYPHPKVTEVPLLITVLEK